jgi:hypothetical protein
MGLRDPKRFREVVMMLKKGRYVGKDGEASAFTPVPDSLSGAIHGIQGTADSGGSLGSAEDLKAIRELLSVEVGLMRSIEESIRTVSTEMQLMRSMEKTTRSMDEKLSLMKQ